MAHGLSLSNQLAVGFAQSYAHGGIGKADQCALHCHVGGAVWPPDADVLAVLGHMARITLVAMTRSQPVADGSNIAKRSSGSVGYSNCVHVDVHALPCWCFVFRIMLDAASVSEL